MDMSGMSGMDMSELNSGSSATSTTSDMMHMSAMSMASATTTSMTMSGMDMSVAATTTMAMNMSGMEMSSSTSMDMNMGSMTGTASMATATSTSMSMSMSCTMSMLWNWYSKDVCFISSQWKTSTKALFGGTCVGVFALLITINWWRRILFQYKIYCSELRKEEVGELVKAGVSFHSVREPFDNVDFSKNENMFVEWMVPFAETWKHKWFWALNKNLAVEVGDHIYLYPSIWEHLIFCVGDTMEWSVHHVIMLLFMYFNGYVFISCMIGAGTGFLLWQYKNINTAKRGDNVSKRCCL